VPRLLAVLAKVCTTVRIKPDEDFSVSVQPSVI
jgi:hypothetical protein